MRISLGIILALSRVVTNVAADRTTDVTPTDAQNQRPIRRTQAAWSALDGIDDIGVQYASVYGRTDPARNHLRLMAAILTDSIRVFSKHRSPRRRREELVWLTSRDRTAVFAFENVCEALGIEAERVRRHVITQSGALPAPEPSIRPRAAARSPEFAIVRRAG